MTEETTSQEIRNLDTEAKMKRVAQWLHDKKATDIVALDVNGLCSIAEGVVVASAGSVKHAQGLSDWVLKQGKEDIGYLGSEGYRSGTWILLDLNDVLVHIFQRNSRGFYNLEGLWSEARAIELGLPDEEADEDDE